MISLLIKLLLTVFAPILLIVGFVLLVPRILSVDDLSGCHGPQQVDAACRPADAIVAISGGDTDARAREAIGLYKQGWAQTIIFSGAAEDKEGASNAAAMKTMALGAGMPADAILLDEQSVNTADNASQVRPIVLQHGFRRLILVTSPYHQRRASIEFNRRLGDVASIVNHPTSSDRDWPAATWWLTPRGLWLGASELVKVIVVSMSHG